MLTRLFFKLTILLMYFNNTNASNAGYITLSNQIARKQALEIITNNAANSNTTGFEEDGAILNKYDVLQNKRKKNSFVITRGMYKPGDQGSLKYTHNPLDIAIIESNQYFKVFTPRGIRYTLNGAVLRNNQNLLVNSEGYPFLTINNDVLQLPEGSIDIRIASDGMVYADDVAIERIGVSLIEDKYALEKEGNSLYKSNASEVPSDNFTLATGALRMSNVNAGRIMSETIEAQRSFSTTTNLLNEIGDIEKQSFNRILKAQ